MRHRLWALGVLVGLGLVTGCEKQRVASTQPAETQPQPETLASWNFDELQAGELPKGFTPKQNNPTTALAAWKVVVATDAPSKPNALEVQTKNANATYNLLLAEGTSFADLDLNVKVKGTTGNDDQGGGLIWRAKDENNYYVCRINPLETNFRVYKVVDGKRKQLQSAEVKTESNKWYDLRVVMAGNHIQCYLDGQKLLDVHDDEFKEAGMIGVWTKADASSSFDDLAVRRTSTPAIATNPQ